MNPNSDGPQNPGADKPKPARRPQTSVRTLIVLVGCCGAILWGWRYASENFDPVRVEARSIQRRVIGALRSDKPAERLTAIVELGRLDAGDRAVAIPSLIVALEDPIVAVRVAAVEALGWMVLHELKSRSGGEDARAAATALIRCLKDPEPSVRSASADSLGRIASTRLASGTAPPINRKAVMDALAEMLGDREAGARRAAIRSIASIPAENGDPPRALAEGLKDESAENRAGVVNGLISYGQGLDPWVPILLRLAEHDPDLAVRERSVSTMSHAFKVPAVTPAVVPVLTASLGSAEAAVRSQAARLLGEFRADSRAAIPGLLRVLNEPLDPRVVPVRGPGATFDPACEAASSLGRIAPGSSEAKEVISALMEVARSGPLSRRGWAAYTLGEFGPAAEEAVPVLIQVLRDATPDDTFERGASAAHALGMIAPETPSPDRAFAALLPALQSKVELSRAKAIEALSRFGPRAAAAVRPLKDDRSVEVRQAAAKVLLALENKHLP